MPRSQLSTRGSTAAWRRRRAIWQERINAGDHIVCARGDQCLYPDRVIRPGMKWDLDHHNDDGDDTNTAPAHLRCNRSAGGKKGGTTTGAMIKAAAQAKRGGAGFCEAQTGTAFALSENFPPVPAEPEWVEPVGFDERAPVWRVPWLLDLLEIPDDAVWPRLMTVPHPRAVGSLGVEFEEWVLRRAGRRLRWWQRLVARRVLEVDTDGRLVWDTWLLSLARQLGKSWLLRELFFWRIHQGARFGEEQTVLHTGKDLAVCKDVQRPLRVWAKARRDEYHVREVNGQEEIELRVDGSRWLLRAKEAVYGQTATMCGVDEAWKVAASVVDEGVEPTLVEVEQGQLALVSTAHRKATSLMLDRRLDAIAALATGAAALIIEWSGPFDSAVDDEHAWRLASPHWTPNRARLVAKAVARALSGETIKDADEPDPIEAVRAQWLNIWPRKRAALKALKGEPLIDMEQWGVLEVVDAAAGPITVVIEDDRHGGAAVAAAFMRDDGRVVVTGVVVDAMAAAAAQARAWLAAVPGSRLLVGASMLSEPELRPMLNGHNAVGQNELRGGLALFRRAMAAARLWHDEECADLTEQLGGARVVETSAGLALVAGPGRTDLVRAAVWAVQAVYDAPPTPRIW